MLGLFKETTISRIKILEYQFRPSDTVETENEKLYIFPVDFLGITKFHSNQLANRWKQWRKEESGDVLCPTEAYKKLFWWFVDFDQFARN